MVLLLGVASGLVYTRPLVRVRRDAVALRVLPEDDGFAIVLSALAEGEKAAESGPYEERGGAYVFEPPGMPWGVVHFVAAPRSARFRKWRT